MSHETLDPNQVRDTLHHVAGDLEVPRLDETEIRRRARLVARRRTGRVVGAVGLVAAAVAVAVVAVPLLDTDPDPAAPQTAGADGRPPIAFLVGDRLHLIDDEGTLNVTDVRLQEILASTDDAVWGLDQERGLRSYRLLSTGGDLVPLAEQEAGEPLRSAAVGPDARDWAKLDPQNRMVVYAFDEGDDGIWTARLSEGAEIYAVDGGRVLLWDDGELQVRSRNDRVTVPVLGRPVAADLVADTVAVTEMVRGERSTVVFRVDDGGLATGVADALGDAPANLSPDGRWSVGATPDVPVGILEVGSEKEPAETGMTGALEEAVWLDEDTVVIRLSQPGQPDSLVTCEAPEGTCDSVYVADQGPISLTGSAG